MSGSPRSGRDWVRRHSPMLVNGACLLASLWLAPQLVPGATFLPAGGIALALVVLASVPTLAPDDPAGLWAHVRPYLRGQLAVAVVCLVAGRLFWTWPWLDFSFLPLWTGLTALALARRFSQSRPVQLLMTPGNETALTGALVAGFTAFLFGRLALPEGLGCLALLGPALGWLLLDRLPGQRWQDAADSRSRLARFAIRLLLWALGTGATALLTGEAPARTQLALVTTVGAALALFGLSHRHLLVAGTENAARVVFGLAIVAIVNPLAHRLILGTQDAQWYMNTLADFITQVREGVFPVFIGQSEYLFNGGVLPVRFAPLFQHYGLLLDLLTLRSLPPIALQNGVLIGSFVGAALTCRAMLARLLPGRPWTTTGLSLLYLTCPGVLAVAYFEDLYMTWTTLPWLPLVFGGCVLSFRSHEPGPFILLGAALGLVWWGHAPVALWTTLAVGVIQAGRLIVTPPREWPWRALLCAGAALGAIGLYPIVSVLSLSAETGTAGITYDATEILIRITHFIREAFPGILVPPFLKARSVSDYQLGWALLAALGLGLGVLIRRREKFSGLWLMFLVPLALQLLLLPIPGANRAIWSALPGFLVNPTGFWPMQRLYLIMAAGIVCAVAGLLHAEGDLPRPRPWLPGLLVAGLLWSALAASPFVRQQLEQRRALSLAVDWSLPENHVLTRYAYLYLGPPPRYYSHGHVDPLYEQRFLSASDRRWVGGNPNAILGDAKVGRVLSAGALTAAMPHPGDPWRVSPSFTLAPHKRQALALHFQQGAIPGVLVLNAGNLRQNYGLPAYGGKLSFGSNPDSSPLLPLHTSGPQPVAVPLQFVSQEPGAARDFSQFGTYRWLEVNLDALPIRVTSWIPYRAEIDAPAGVWLETPRMFLPGYRATVNGTPVTPEQSPDGLVSVPVPAGRSTVVVTYHAAAWLQLSYWISFLAILAGAGLLLRQAGARPYPHEASPAVKAK